VSIQRLHDRQPDNADILEGFLGCCLTARGVLTKIVQEVLETRIRLQPFLPPLFVGTPSLLVGLASLFVPAGDPRASRAAGRAALSGSPGFRDRSRARVVRRPCSNLSRGDDLFNVLRRIQPAA